jgi:hypothetical protein
MADTPPPPPDIGKSKPVNTLHPKTEEPKNPTLSPVAPSPTPKKQYAPTKKEGGEQENMSTNPQTGKPTFRSPTPGLVEKPEKYTTHLEPSLVKQLKLFAVEKDLKDYQVIKNALLLYFKQNK